LHDLPEEGEVKEELIRAVTDEFREYETLKRANEDLQMRIIKNDSSKMTNDDGAIKEQTLSEHKYLNTLANVHQVRFNLKETQERYNRMASEL